MPFISPHTTTNAVGCSACPQHSVSDHTRVKISMMIRPWRLLASLVLLDEGMLKIFPLRLKCIKSHKTYGFAAKPLDGHRTVT